MNLWTDHGTKLLGAFTTLLGLITAAAPDTLTSIFGPKGPAIAVAAGGLLTILRGFQNSAKQPEAVTPPVKP